MPITAVSSAYFTMQTFSHEDLCYSTGNTQPSKEPVASVIIPDRVLLHPIFCFPSVR